MQEVQRVGLPNLLSQGELMARTRGTPGAEVAVRDHVALALAKQAQARAAELRPVTAVEAAGRRRRDPRDGEERQDRRERGGEHDLLDDEPGHAIDVTA